MTRELDKAWSVVREWHYSHLHGSRCDNVACQTADKMLEAGYKDFADFRNRIRVLEEALGPLADKYDDWMSDYNDNEQVRQEYTHFTYGELRRAREAIAEVPTSEQGH